MRENPEFESFVRARSGSLLRTAVLLVGDYGHAEDLLQVALLRTARHWRTARAAPEAYVRRVLLNLCRDRWRRLKARPPEAQMLPDSSETPATGGLAEQVGRRQVLVQALGRLPAGQRQVIVLRYFEDLPVAETAELLGISPGTVKSYTARALTALRAVLADDAETPGTSMTMTRRPQMLTDDQLAARIGPRLRAELADLPVPDLPTALRHRQARQARRARVTVALTALPVAAAAFAAAAFLPGSAAQKTAQPITQNTAYVLSHVTRALDTVPAGTIMFSRQTWGINASVVYRWDNGTRERTEVFTHGGRLETDGGDVLEGSTLTGIVIDYGSKTWELWSFTKDAADNPIPSCASWHDIMFGSGNTGETAAWLHDAVSCGVLTAAGTASVDGVTAIKLTGSIGINSPATMTYYVNPTTYLPVRLVLGHTLQADYQWLPPTPANLAKLALPAPPAGFTQERG